MLLINLDRGLRLLLRSCLTPTATVIIISYVSIIIILVIVTVTFTVAVPNLSRQRAFHHEPGSAWSFCLLNKVFPCHCHQVLAQGGNCSVSVYEKCPEIISVMIWCYVQIDRYMGQLNCGPSVRPKVWLWLCSFVVILFIVWLYPKIEKSLQFDFELNNCHSTPSSLTCWLHGVLHQHPYCNLFTHLANTAHGASSDWPL